MVKAEKSLLYACIRPNRHGPLTPCRAACTGSRLKPNSPMKDFLYAFTLFTKTAAFHSFKQPMYLHKYAGPLCMYAKTATFKHFLWGES